MPGSGGMNLKGRNKVKDRWKVLFWTLRVMREEDRRSGKKIPVSGFIPTQFGIGQIAKSRAIGVFVIQYSGDSLVLQMDM